nr:AAA family ATPase [uncultured Fretibacterium sp.]
MSEELQTLPIGIQSFEMLRKRGHLYVDKTARLMELVSSDRHFLSRPRRFGKSLTLSTLDAMFQGKAELFKDLAAEGWVAEQARHPCPVLSLSMARGRSVEGVRGFDISLYNDLMVLGRKQGLPMLRKDTEGALGAFKDVLEGLYDQGGPVVVLIDEYDKPILDRIGDLEAAEAMREALRGFYTVLKDYDSHLRFVMLTGISKFTKTGVFSAMNNLRDISMSEPFGDIVGYTQEELEADFADWIGAAAEKMNVTRETLLQRMKDYYDGFCFDGKTRLYNPFSILNFLADREFKNYWYHSGSPTFILSYLRSHGIDDPEVYRHKSVPADFTDNQEIERAKPESFLFQSGYLTIESVEEQELTLDYPNREVLDSISRLYLDNVYRVEGFTTLGSNLWRALKDGDIEGVVKLYNTALAGIPYQDFTRQNESLYRSLFLMLLRGAGVTAQGEVPTNRGRSDVLVLFPSRVVVLEFKLAQGTGEVARLRAEGRKQIEEKGYAKPHDGEGRAVTTAVIVVDAKKHTAG